ncbi:MAG: molecular chaperone HtpG [Bacilli bacterium]|nr:molecular chaperone HtpG [Bacilli bacterium]
MTKLKKQFKAESKKLLDMMINSIYTNKEIFLRELISNASDAIDKLYYRSLTDKKVSVNKDELEIRVSIDKENRTLTISDNGIGMTEEELEENLGTIAKSGSELFKQNNDKEKDISIIGQFGVGFYSSFMVSDKVEVTSKSIDSEKSYKWVSTGVSGYTIEEAEKKNNGTEIVLYLKKSTDENNYEEFLEEYNIEMLIRKYSDYIHYPIKMLIEKTEKKDDKEEKVSEDKTLNSMIPIWKKNTNEVKEEEYNDFYTDKFYDYEKPIKVIRSNVEGRCSYTSLLFIPSHAPFDYYSKEYEKGLQLYSKGVLIMDKCSELLPDYFSFVKGLVDSEDISLNVSRETLQENYQIELIEKSLETKIKKELENMLKENREDYEKFFKDFGMQLKYGVYSSYGNKKDVLGDLLLFTSSKDKKYTTLKEYVERMKENQSTIYYACGESIDKIDLLPQVESVKEKDYEILYLTDYMDEFVFKTMMEYDGKNFMNVSDEKMDLDSEEEKEELKKNNEKNSKLFDEMKSYLKENVSSVRFTHKLKNHPVCLTSKGEVSTEMEKVLNSMPNNMNNVKAETILEINENHPISKKLEELYKEKNKEELEKYTKILYQEARLIEGLPIENPTELTNLVCELISK